MEEKTKTTNKSREQRRRELTLLRGFLKGSWLMFGVSILMAALTALADMISPQIIRAAVDNAIGGKTPSYSPWVMSLVDSVGGFAYLGQHLWIMAAAVLAVALVKVISQYVYRVSNTKASETMVKTMRDSLFGHIERLPFEWHMKNRTGDIIQRCTSDIDTTRNFVSEQLSSILRIVIMLVLSMIFMFRMNVLLTVIALILVAVLALALEKKGGAVVLAGREMQLLPRKANYLLVYVTCIGGIVAVAAAQFAGAAVAYYLMYAAVAWVFALLVYYTVKMM